MTKTLGVNFRGTPHAKIVAGESGSTPGGWDGKTAGRSGSLEQKE